MNAPPSPSALLALSGDDAPSVVFDDSRLVLTYTAAAYVARCSADDESVRARFRVISAEVEQRPVHHRGPIEGGAQVVTYVVAPLKSPAALPIEQPKPRR